MKIIKRSGQEVTFDSEKIAAAVAKANAATNGARELTPTQIRTISDTIEAVAVQIGRALSVEEIQELVETEIMKEGAYETAKRYIRYRYTRSLARAANTTDEQILTLIESNNEEVMQENSNKDPKVNAVQRDYMAGEVSKDLTKRVLLPTDIVEAHEQGIIHFHDMDYFAQHMHNCDLVNLEDMLQNGTVISGTMIEKPHSFSTACNIATQIIAQVASNQYGGQSISLAHLAPFVDVSRRKIRKEVEDEFKTIPLDAGCDDVESVIFDIVEGRVREEVKRGVQTIQYQVITLMTTNGQAPFITVFMYIDEVPEGQERDDLAMIIEEVLRQRMQGVKNEKGVWITPAFPKLIYVLDEDNIRKGTKFWHLTELAGTVEEAHAIWIIRDHDTEKFEERKAFVQDLVSRFETKHPGCLDLRIHDQYLNMARFAPVTQNGEPEAVREAREAVAAQGLKPESVPVRGGTDGAMLSAKGLFTPNLGTGSWNHHGRYEFASVQKMETMKNIVKTLMKGRDN